MLSHSTLQVSNHKTILPQARYYKQCYHTDQFIGQQSQDHTSILINELDELLNTSDVAQDVAYGTQRLTSGLFGQQLTELSASSDDASICKLKVDVKHKFYRELRTARTFIRHQSLLLVCVATTTTTNIHLQRTHTYIPPCTYIKHTRTTCIHTFGFTMQHHNIFMTNMLKLRNNCLLIR